MSSHSDDGKINWEEVGLQPLRLRPRSRGWASFLGYFVSQTMGLGALSLVTLLLSQFGGLGGILLAPWAVAIFAWSQFLTIPFGMGLIAAYFWLDERAIKREANDRPVDMNGSVLLNTIFICIGTAFTPLRDAEFVILGAPLFCFFMWIGTRAGGKWWLNHPFLSV
ncbi:MAG TPA: hypothetical protein VGB45_05675 [Abditibacterium sp.]|jgi:hypothetical protein